MKKISTYLSVLFYLIATTGFSAKVHFCGGEVAEVAVLSSLRGNVCGCVSEDEIGDCCQEKSFEYKVDTKHLVKANIQNNPNFLFIAFFINPTAKETSKVAQLSWIDKKWQGGKSPPLWVLNCVYRL